MNGSSVLGEIVAATRQRVAERKRDFPIERLMAVAQTPHARRPFAPALCAPGRVNVIAEFKRRSPSRGLIRGDLHPVAVAQGYEVAGAAALSVLTNQPAFGGSLEDLQEARSATLLPTLQKDFVVDPYQVREARLAGADAILLIAAVLSEAELVSLHETARSLSLDVLVEVHDRDELERALGAGASLLGVNNRDLRSMEVSLETAFALAPAIPDEVVAVAESGIRSAADLRRLREAGYDAFLVGEHLMSQPDPGQALERLLAEASA